MTTKQLAPKTEGYDRNICFFMKGVPAPELGFQEPLPQKKVKIRIHSNLELEKVGQELAEKEGRGVVARRKGDVWKWKSSKEEALKEALKKALSPKESECSS